MYLATAALLGALACVRLGVDAQVPPATPQSTGFNSSFTLSHEQVQLAQLSESVARSIEAITNYDRSQLAFGGPLEDDFYTLPPLTNQAGPVAPGTLLKVQPVTDPTSYVIPPNTALSRILYTTTNLNGTVIPTSGFVLWPYQPRRFSGGSTRTNSSSPAPVVLWTHGASGTFPNNSPSSHRALWFGYAAPFALALDGYAVVAPDYAGLGISKSWDGSDIPHEFLAGPAAANDALYALCAAWDAFPGMLSSDFVVVGHSQGGGAAWAVSEALEARPDEFPRQVRGHRGTVAGSPTTDVFAGLPEVVLPWVGMVLDKVFSDFRLESWLTPLGIARTKLLGEVQGGIGVTQQLYLSDGDVVKADYNETSWHAAAYHRLASSGRKAFKGPMLVLQGTDDLYVRYETTDSTVRDTCDSFPGAELEFLVLPGVAHVPALPATQPLWLRWIADRFEGRPVARDGCHRRKLKSFLPIEQYQVHGNSFPQWAGSPEYSYQVPLGP
ncbi:hypothetical protein ACRE_025970 [Hapsidospora chrysogenum ATCC 11550]|uniref:AB hydrolase-1 domain-containing protein n=1 Tax=Hapsidospora chrysogenum (strain ATCC 11550 / CBS 779.69 / DSM 880 / IAM 14645 / JCM 23072 / IMI 49137) TaxID=857340 RepID=A0A086TB28_HAPC1|nr:hypothetical protein ACRE_025970 [Hapsidospora chrysogenum ATCC 11550]